VAKTSYTYEPSVAKISNMLSVAKSWSVESSVAKAHVSRCIGIATASLATARVSCYNF